MPKKHEQPPEFTAGDSVKEVVDDGMAAGMRAIWKRVREVGAGSFFKGAVLTGLAITAAMLLVAGYLGAGSSLEVSGALMNTFEKGAGAGISTALDFLTHGLGIATMAAGGAAFVASDIIQEQKRQAAQETERLALEYERNRQNGKDRARQQSQNQNKKTEPSSQQEKEAEAHRKAYPKGHGGIDEDGNYVKNPATAKDSTKDNIYVKGSVIKTDKFCAAELKRRTETTMEAQVG